MPNRHSVAACAAISSLHDLSLRNLTRFRRPYYPSPASWEDEILYFLMLDRFSDGREYQGFRDANETPVDSADSGRQTPMFISAQDAGKADWDAWFRAGRGWCGGNLKGLSDKIGYLKRLGVGAVWISPVFKQVTGSDNYHGYGIQDFLEVDPHFGTKEDLVRLVEAAHKAGIRVILDIILNHAGDVFAYRDNHPYYYHEGKQWEIQGFRKSSGCPGELTSTTVTHASRDEGVWPSEFQDLTVWSRNGEIRNWDAYPEYIDGDFLSLKNLHLGYEPKDPSISWDMRERVKAFSPSRVLDYLIKVYRYWIALADIDGYRIDTVKHMEPGAVRIFVNAIHEYAQSLGKENFYMIGEVTGGRANAVATVDHTGLDAALGIDDIQDKLEFLAKGFRSPGNPETDDQVGYFDYFRNSILDDKNTHQWYAKHVVVMFDDHDQVGTRHKFRFCGQGDAKSRLLIPAIALNLTTMGIPCLYYGTEQAFNGGDSRPDDDSYSDVFLRECMFGGPFGSFRSAGRHFFNEAHPVYGFVSRLAAFRKDTIALRRGRQYLREVSGSGESWDFHYPQMLNGELRWVVAWSRIFADEEYLCAINTDPAHSIEVWVTVDRSLHPEGTSMGCVFADDGLRVGSSVRVESRNGSSVRIMVPPAGFLIFH
ncbi:MAG: alpha-amylase family glycosyl hydrolase [Opitutales bacterium]|nr:alpha-amylase family glycosyl hydrolase [Opitutales bacterium]